MTRQSPAGTGGAFFVWRVAPVSYIFPGQSKGTHLTMIRRLWDAVRVAAKLEDVRGHDLRHSFASAWALGGNTLFVIGKLLGHGNVATTARYSHLADDRLRAAAESTASTVAAWLLGQRRP